MKLNMNIVSLNFIPPLCFLISCHEKHQHGDYANFTGGSD